MTEGGGRKPALDDFPARVTEKIRFGDTDRLGHVNNAVFASFCESGRTAVLWDEALGLQAAESYFVLARLAIDFHSELLWPGEVEIGTRVARLGRSSITMVQAIFQNGVCAATADSVVVRVSNATRRSIPHPDHVVARLAAHMA